MTNTLQPTFVTSHTDELSHAQRQIWVGQQLQPDVPVYNMALAFTIEGPLDPARFATAFSDVIAVVDSLRTTFPLVDGAVKRLVLEHITFELPLIELAESAAADTEAKAYLEAGAQTMLSLEERCFDAALLRCRPDKHIWFLKQHHLIGDAAAFVEVYRQVVERYQELEHGTRRPAQPSPEYQVLVDWEHSDRGRTARAAATDHWAAAAETTTSVEPVYGRLVVDPGTDSVRVTQELGVARTAKLDELAVRPGVRAITPALTSFNILAGVITAWLARTGGSPSVGFGFFAHNRTQRAFRNVVGTFVELFPFTNDVDPEDTFVSLIQRTSGESMVALRHAQNGASDPELTRELGAVFNHITAELASFGDRRVHTDWIHTGHIEAGHAVRIQFHDFDGSGELTAIFDFNNSWFDPDERTRAVEHFFTVLDACLDEPDALIYSTGLAGRLEQRQLLEIATTQTAPTPASLPVLRDIENWAVTAGDRAACVDGSTSITYRQLDERANALAHHLVEVPGCSGGVVAVSTNRTVDFAVAILAARKAGAAYLPLDPCDPVARQQAVLDQAEAVAVVAHAPTVADARQFERPVLLADTEEVAPSPPGVEIHNDDRAYLLGTSGSTGVPKVVQIEHRNLRNLVTALDETVYRRLEAGPLDVAVVAPFGFDPSVQQIFAALALGHTLHIVPEETRYDGGGLIEFLLERSIDVCDGTPAHLRIMLDGSQRLDVSLPVHFLIGGDVLPRPLARRFLERYADDRLAVLNVYGPAECCVDTTGWPVDLETLDDRHTVPIGIALPGTRAYVIDDFGNLQPFGLAGQLVVAGAGVGRGYRNLPELTAERFGEDPYVPGNRRFMTGDLARMSSDGVIEFVERRDLLVKVQGHRVELSEVESALKAFRSTRRMIPVTAAEPTRCTRCLLSERHPGVTLVDGVCSTCRRFDESADAIASYFGTVADFRALIDTHDDADNGPYDVMLLYSGGKDSSYVLYQLVELGLRVLAFTFDNDHISDAAFANIERQTKRLGVDSLIMSAEHMDEIFLQSLTEKSTVCDGCFRALTAISSQVAIDKGITTMVTGLSRGQIFDTKLAGLLDQGLSDADEIDEKLQLFRAGYHSRQDLTSELLGIDLDANLLQTMHFIDWFRYDAASTAEVRAFLQSRDSYWSQPEDTGFCSSNCRMNDVGIAVHSTTKGFHNYEQPLSWDIRLGVLDRNAGLQEIRPPEETGYIAETLNQLGYLDRRVDDAAVTVVENDTGARELHAFFVSKQTLTVDELRNGLGKRLPGYMIPTRFQQVDEIPLTANGKVDRSALVVDDARPNLATSYVAPRTDTENLLCDVWCAVLELDKVGVHDDFRSIGGDSIKALEVVALAADRGLHLAPKHVFTASTIAILAEVADEHHDPSDEAAAAVRSGPVRRSDPTTPPPLAPAEAGLLFDQELRPDERMFNISRSYDVPMAIDTNRFERALRQVASRHEPLQWTFGTTRRLLTSDEAVAVRVEPERQPGASVRDRFAAVQAEPFDIERGPLLRCVIQPLSNGHTSVSLHMHHVSADHLSFEILWRAIAAAYEGQDLVEPEIGYSDLVRWQSESWDAASAFWSGRTFGSQFDLSGSDNGEHGYLEITSDLAAEDLRNTSPLFATALAAAAVAARPLCTENDVELCLVASARNHELARPLVGLLTNPLPMQFDVSPDRTFASLIDDVSSTASQALVHASYPLARIVQDARRDGRPAPTGRVLVAVVDDKPLTLDGETVEHHVLFNGFAVADLTFFLQVYDDNVVLGVEYSPNVGTATAELALDHFRQSVETIVADPNAVVTSCDNLVGEASVVVGPALPEAALVADTALSQLRADAERIAVEVGESRLSRGELLARATHVAEQLRSHGAERGSRVVVRAERSVHLPPVILGIWLAGASYVPIVAATATDRTRALAHQVDASIEIVPPHGTGTLATSLVIDDESFAGRPWPDQAVPPDQVVPTPTGTDEAYVIFTSGSTGEANPVAVSHHQLSASTNARSLVYDEPPARFAVLSGLGFDSSLVGLVWTLVSGGTIVMPRDDAGTDIDSVVQLLATGSISHSLCVPTLYGLLLSRRKDGDPWPAHMIVAGEACTPGLVESHFASVPNSRLTNEYGPTEASIWATAHHCKPAEGVVPIGQPIPGGWICVVDDAGRVVPWSVPGELVIGGPTIAAYLAGPSDRFTAAGEVRGLPDTIDADSPVFRSGDRVVACDGTIQFLGRADDQLNVGGVRVEPLEIEAALLEVDGVDAAAVVAVDVRGLGERIEQASAEELAAAFRASADSPNPEAALRSALASTGSPDVRLVAHVAGPQCPDPAVIRADVARLLEPLQRPSLYGVHGDLPRTANGKLDRAAAAHLPIEPASSGGTDPRANTAASSQIDLVAALFGEVLRTTPPAPDSSFFDLGGDSIRAIELLRLIEDRTGVHLPTSAVHEAPTPNALAAELGALARTAGEPGDETIVMRIRDEGSRTPVFALHNLGVNGSMWRPLAERLGSDQPFYGIADPYALLEPFSDSYNLEHKPEIAETAASYVNEIERLAPTGPVALLGFCLGGVLGHEVAQQLTTRGRTVERFVVILDWHAPHLTYDENFFNMLQFGYRRSGKSVVGYAKSVLTTRAFVKSLRRRAEHLAVRFALRLGIRLNDRLERRHYVEESIDRIHSYVYEPYAGPVTIVRSCDDPRIPTNLGTAGWQNLLSDLEVVYLPGVGERMLHEPYIDAVAAAVRNALDGRPAAG